MMKKRDFDRCASRCVPEIFGSLGFSETDPGAFTRPVENILHGFGFTLHRSHAQFCVPVGVSVPCLHPKVEHVMQGHYPALTISQRLGELRNSGTGIEQWYSVSSNDELSNVFELVYRDFVEQALPWLEELNSLDSVAREFFQRRIAPPPTGEKRRPDPFAWAIYGWMLEESGKKEESEDWLRRATFELVRPTYMKNGRLLDHDEAGATQLQKSQEEERLLQLLRQTTG
jgi:hypothetical protein